MNVDRNQPTRFTTLTEQPDILSRFNKIDFISCLGYICSQGYFVKLGELGELEQSSMAACH